MNCLKTVLWRVDSDNIEQDIINKASCLIKKGGVVAFPTETVYGLGANGLDATAVKKIFLAKGRQQDNPLILHVADIKEVYNLAREVTAKARILIEKFWPGPLTVVLPKQNYIPLETTAGLDTVAIRMPAHPVALALIREAGVPLAAPSANKSGYPSPTRAVHVWNDLSGKIDAILDGGATGLGLESTVIDLTEEIPVILRPGGITREQLEAVVGSVIDEHGAASDESIPKAPGMKYKHYSPRAKVILLDGSPEEIRNRAFKLTEEYKQKGLKIALLYTREVWQDAPSIETDYLANLGSRKQLEQVAHNLYHELRCCDEEGVNIILTETYQEEGLGVALMNRLLKSAGHQILK